MTRGPHLVLVGLMGAGKTTVARRCADRLGRSVVDTDELVEAALGASVAEIFARDGEATFRELERRAVEDACASPEPAVVACGGGAVLDGENRRRMREAGLVVWLDAPPEVLAARVEGAGDRPLLTGGDPVEALRRLAELREPAYRAAAHAVVDTTERDADDAADAVVAVFEGAPA